MKTKIFSSSVGNPPTNIAKGTATLTTINSKHQGSSIIFEDLDLKELKGILNIEMNLSMSGYYVSAPNFSVGLLNQKEIYDTDNPYQIPEYSKEIAVYRDNYDQLIKDIGCKLKVSFNFNENKITVFKNGQLISNTSNTNEIVKDKIIDEKKIALAINLGSYNYSGLLLLNYIRIYHNSDIIYNNLLEYHNTNRPGKDYYDLGDKIDNIPNGWIRIDDRDSRIRKTGMNDYSMVGRGCWNDTISYGSKTNNASIECTFVGTKIRMLGHNAFPASIGHSALGRIWGIYIDGTLVEKRSFSYNNSGADTGMLLQYESPDLNYGTHTIKVTAESTADWCINFDCFDIKIKDSIVPNGYNFLT